MTGNNHPPSPTENRIEDGHPMVLAYRVGQVEQTLNQIVGKLDLISQNYPTTATIQLLLEPLKDRVIDLEAKNEKEENARTTASAQLKLALVVAAVTPAFTIIVTLILTGAFK